MIKELKRQYKNALVVIKQIKKGEWEFKGSYRHSLCSDFTCYTAERNGVELWVGSGALYCGIRDQPWQLGFFGLLVWFFAARSPAKALERRMKRKPDILK